MCTPANCDILGLVHIMYLHALAVGSSTARNHGIFAGSANVLIMGAGGLGQWALSFARVLFPPNCKVFAADSSVSAKYPLFITTVYE